MPASTVETTQPQARPSMVADPGAQSADQVANANKQQEVHTATVTPALPLYKKDRANGHLAE